MQPIILGIDPGTRYMGVAVLQGQRLAAFGVHTLRNGEHVYDLIGQAREIILRYIARHRPQIVVIERPLLVSSKRAALVSAISQELSERAKELGLSLLELTPEEVRKIVVGNPRATKIDVAESLARRFDQLKGLVPKQPVRTALGLRPRDKYWLHAFDALALSTVQSHANERESL